jgi:nuclear pore complex protein Nup205
MPVVAGAVFTLTAHLSQAVRTEQKQPLVSGPGEAHYAFMLDCSFTSPPPAESPLVGFASIGDSSLHIILKKLLDFILKTGFSSKFCINYNFVFVLTFIEKWFSLD